MINILVTAIGSFSADITVKTLKQMGMRVIACDIYEKELIVEAINVDSFYQVCKAVDPEKYIEQIMAICVKEEVDYILPLTDVEVDVLNAHRERLSPCKLCISGADTISLCRDKLKLYKYLQNCGIKELIQTLEIDQMAKLDYPYIIKPRNGRSSLGLRCINNDIDASYVKQSMDLSGYIAQPQIDGDVICVDIVSDGECIVAIPRRELLRSSNGAGLSVHVYRDTALNTVCKRIAGYLGVRGCVNFEFIQDKFGMYYFLECNPRFSGGIEFSCMAGYNCVENHMNYFLRDKIEEIKSISDMYIARKYEEYITSVN